MKRFSSVNVVILIKCVVLIKPKLIVLIILLTNYNYYNSIFTKNQRFNIYEMGFMYKEKLDFDIIYFF